MPITTASNATDILNRVAVEVGLDAVVDPYSSQDQNFIQLRTLLNIAGEELAQAYAWGDLVKEHQVITDGVQSDFPLPDDFYYMIDQTGWERSQNVPLFGPLSPQDWQYLKGRNLVSSTIYASFRLNEGVFRIFPQPAPANLDIYYEYMSKNWVSNGQPTPQFKDSVDTGSDVPLYDKTLISRFLKVKWLDAKGLDSTKAQQDFNQSFSFITGFDKGAEILSIGGRSGYPYLNMYRNVPDTGYGGVI